MFSFTFSVKPISSLVFCLSTSNTVLFSSTNGDVLWTGEEGSWHSWTILRFTLSGLKGIWLWSTEGASGSIHIPIAKKKKKIKIDAIQIDVQINPSTCSNCQVLFYFLIYIFFFVWGNAAATILPNMLDLSSLTRGWICVPCSGSTEFYSLDHQGSP